MGSIAAQIARPWLFPEWLFRDSSMFARKLSTGELVLSFFLELLFDYGPVAAVAMVMILFAVESKGASGGSPSRPADWHRRM